MLHKALLMLHKALFSIACAMGGFMLGMVLAEFFSGGIRARFSLLFPICSGGGGILGLILAPMFAPSNLTAGRNAPVQLPRRSLGFYILKITAAIVMLGTVEWAKISFVGWPWIDRISDPGWPHHGPNGPWLLLTLIELFTIWMILRTIRLAPKRKVPRF